MRGRNLVTARHSLRAAPQLVSRMGVLRLCYAGGMEDGGDTALHPALATFPWGSPLPQRLVQVVNDLHARGAEVVTVADLARTDTGTSPEDTARALRRAGWLQPLRTRGAWAVDFVASPSHIGAFVELRARLRTHPDTPAVIAGKSVALEHRWLRRGVAATIGCPPNYKVPRCLSGYSVCRWEPQIALDSAWGLPMWKPETMLVFMAARPSQFPWEDIAEWLWEACADADGDLVAAELAGRARSTWMKAAYLISEGDRPDIADILLAVAPDGDTGPYLLGHKEKNIGRFAYPPAWSAKFQVMDYLLPAWWLPRW